MRRQGARAFWWGLAALAAVLSSQGPALAATHTVVGAHYAFSYPDTWTASSTQNGDAVYLGTEDGGFRPNVVAQHEGEQTARGDAAWLLAYAQNSLNQVKSQFAVSDVQAPRTFTAGSGRLSADYIFDRTVGNLTLRQRQVFFVSEFHKAAYFFTLTDKTSTFASHAAEWSLIVDSFAVTGEPSATGMPALVVVAVVVGGAAVAVAVLLVWKARKVAQAPAAPMMAPGAPPPPAR